MLSFNHVKTNKQEPRMKPVSPSGYHTPSPHPPGTLGCLGSRLTPPPSPLTAKPTSHYKGKKRQMFTCSWGRGM